MTESFADLASQGEPTIEDVEQYWDRRPCNIRHSPRQVGTREYFEEVDQRRRFVGPHGIRFAQYERWAGKRVLEVGCGLAMDGASFVRAGADYTGVDVSKESLALAARQFELFGLNGTFHHCNAEQLSSVVPAHSFDMVYSFGVIHHTPNQRAVVEQARRVIRDDGELRIMLYAKNSWKAYMIEAGLDQPEAQAGCPIATMYTPEMIDELLRGLFVLSSLEQAHIFPFVVEKYVKYEYELQPWFKAMPPKLFAILERKLGWHYLIVAKPI